MTSQQQADALLAAWQLLRRQGMPPELRLLVIDTLVAIERAKLSSMRSAQISHAFGNSDRT